MNTSQTSAVPRLSLLALSATLLLLTACGPREAEWAGEEVAATVNGTTILRREVDRVFETTAPPGLSADAVRDRRRQIISDLVRQEILAQQAVTESVEETPEHMLDMRLARRVALSARLERRALQQVPVITDAQLQQFLDANRVPLGNRMLLTIEELFIPKADAAFLRELDKFLEGGAGLARLETITREAGVPARRETSSRSTDQLPPEVLDPLLRAGLGKPIIIRTASGQGVVLVLQQMAPAALTGAAAADYARARMQRAYDRGALDRLYAQPFEAAAISYHGEFEDIPSKEPVLTEAPGIDRRQWAMAGGTLVAWALFLPALVGLLRFRAGSLWLPYLWPMERPGSAPKIGSTLRLALRRERTGALRGWRLFIGRLMVLLWLLSLAALALQTVLAYQTLPHWLVALGVAGGFPVGFALVHLLAKRLLSQREKGHPWLLAVMVLLGQCGLAAAAVLLQPGTLAKLLHWWGA